MPFFVSEVVVYKTYSGPASGAEGRKFKFCYPDQYLQEATFPGSLFILFSGPHPGRMTS